MFFIKDKNKFNHKEKAIIKLSNIDNIKSKLTMEKKLHLKKYGNMK